MPLYLSVAILQCQFLAMYVQFPLFQTVSVASESAEVRGCRPRPLRRPQEGRPPRPRPPAWREEPRPRLHPRAPL